LAVVTLSLLTKTLSRLLHIGIEDAKKYAQTVMNFFGYEDCIIDNLLTPEERRLFYRLERHGVLSSIREETTLHNGNPWRIHYWRLEREKILGGMQGKVDMKPKGLDQHYEDLYATIPKDAWTDRHISNV
jgi:hypothetical protein